MPHPIPLSVNVAGAELRWRRSFSPRPPSARAAHVRAFVALGQRREHGPELFAGRPLPQLQRGDLGDRPRWRGRDPRHGGLRCDDDRQVDQDHRSVRRLRRHQRARRRGAAATDDRHRHQRRQHRRDHAARPRHRGVPGAVGPFPLYGIDIQNAGTVHIEKSSISNFTQPTSACINAAPSAPVIVYVNDSFLRECRTGINVNGTAAADVR